MLYHVVNDIWSNLSQTFMILVGRITTVNKTSFLYYKLIDLLLLLIDRKNILNQVLKSLPPTEN